MIATYNFNANEEFPSEFEKGHSLQFLNLLHKRMCKETSLNSLLNDIGKSNSIVVHSEYINESRGSSIRRES